MIMMVSDEAKVALILIIPSIFLGMLITSPLFNTFRTPAVEAYDQPPVVDTFRDTTRSEQKQVYRFGSSQDAPVTYSDGTIVPSRTFAIEMQNPVTGKWETIGYVNTHGHKVKVDATDQYDLSIGTTIRFNPKT